VKQVHFRFYAELNDFLSAEERSVSFVYRFNGDQTVKHLIESAGVPHTEVDLILANGTSVDFTYRVQDGDRLSVYPVFEAFDISRTSRVRPQPLRLTRFILDTHLGRLAAYLRMLGFDTLYGSDDTDQELSRISAEEHRILLTRDRGLLKRSNVTHGYYVRETNSRAQLLEVLRRFDLSRSVSPFKRCLRCNGQLGAVPKERVWDQIPPRSREVYEEFWRCSSCGRVYWSGSHHRRMRSFIDQVVRQAFQLVPPPPEGA